MPNTATATLAQATARLLVILALIIGGFALAATPAQAAPGPAVCTTDADCAAWDRAHGIPVTEDGYGFDCTLDGNRICGIGAVGGPELAPAADGGTAWTCPAGLPLSFSTAGDRPVCDYAGQQV